MTVPIWKTKNLWYPIAIISISAVLIFCGLVIIGIIHGIVTTIAVLIEYERVVRKAMKCDWFHLDPDENHL